MENKPFDPQNAQPFWQRFGTTIKGVLIFFLILILMIPTTMIEDLIREREGRQMEAFQEVSGKWGRQQTVSGPFLCVPYTISNRDNADKTLIQTTEYAYFLPDYLKINGDVVPEIRKRGIFEVVLYSSKLNMEGSFAPLQVKNLIPTGAVIQWDRATMLLGIPDLVGLDDQVSLQWNNESLVFEPGITAPNLLSAGIHVPVKLSENAGANMPFQVQASLKGSEYLYFTPVGKVTEVVMNSPWADPGFTGAFLPDQKQVSAQGFNANWKVLNLNRNYPQQWTSVEAKSFSESAFGVSFLLPVDNYQKSTRSVKYAILFIALTFLAVFFVEMRQSKRVHAFQYALIGLGLVVFYTLLVSISEQTSFDTAYLTASVMTVGLIALYTRALFQSNKMAGLVGGTLTLLYGFLFVVLQQQDYALLLGSLGLFLILAVVMYFSRKIDW
jgi:inner membrane protein